MGQFYACEMPSYDFCFCVTDGHNAYIPLTDHTLLLSLKTVIVFPSWVHYHFLCHNKSNHFGPYTWWFICYIILFLIIQAVVRAMDTVTDLVSKVRGASVSKFVIAGGSKVTFFSDVSKVHRRTRRGGGVKMPFSGKKPCHVRASNGENIRTRDLSTPERNWSLTPMVKYKA